MKQQATLIAVGLVLASGALAAGERSFVRPSRAGGDGPPFSGAVEVDGTLYVSGTLGLTEDRKVPEDAGQEARLLLDQFRGTLEAAGYSMDDLVSVTVYCSDVTHYDAWNEVYRAYFEAEFPARAFVGSGPLLLGARFEMQGIAVKRE
jgi:enamine deaminase RidA (YjgF/YER057c/UK114 family)